MVRLRIKRGQDFNYSHAYYYASPSPISYFEIIKYYIIQNSRIQRSFLILFVHKQRILEGTTQKIKYCLLYNTLFKYLSNVLNSAQNLH